MRLPGRKLVVRSLRWTRNRLLGGTVVLGYHRVSADPVDPFDLSARPEDFAAHLQFLARRARPETLRQAVADRSGRGSRTVVLTFDDGYADTVHTVLPLLEEYEVPATVFITTGNPGGEYWWDELCRLILEADHLPSVIELDAHRARAFRTDGDRLSLLHELAAVMRVLPGGDRTGAMTRLRELLNSSCGGQRHRALTEQEIRTLAEHPLVEIGAHTVTHPSLSVLPYEDQLNEVRQSRVTLERITQQRVSSFSYPHGSYSEATLRAVQSAGLERACCSTPDTLTRRSSPLSVPRFWLDKCDEATFVREMERWLTN